MHTEPELNLIDRVGYVPGDRVVLRREITPKEVVLYDKASADIDGSISQGTIVKGTTMIVLAIVFVPLFSHYETPVPWVLLLSERGELGWTWSFQTFEKESSSSRSDVRVVNHR